MESKCPKIRGSNCLKMGGSRCLKIGGSNCPKIGGSKCPKSKKPTANWNTLLKYFSWSHFCEFFFVLFQALKVDVGVSRNNFFRSLEMLEMLENV